MQNATYNAFVKNCIRYFKLKLYMYLLSYDVASESEITPHIKIDKPLVVYRFSGKIMKLCF